MFFWGNTTENVGACVFFMCFASVLSFGHLNLASFGLNLAEES